MNQLTNLTSTQDNMTTKLTAMAAYLTALASFVDLLGKALEKEIKLTQGRRYDKISVGSRGAKVRYFVEHATGNIYGAKSELAPNTTRFFGKTFNASKWDWSGEFGKNVSDETVIATGRTYGDVIHYEPVRAVGRPKAVDINSYAVG